MKYKLNDIVKIIKEITPSSNMINCEGRIIEIDNKKIYFRKDKRLRYYNFEYIHNEKKHTLWMPGDYIKLVSRKNGIGVRTI